MQSANSFSFFFPYFFILFFFDDDATDRPGPGRKLSLWKVILKTALRMDYFLFPSPFGSGEVQKQRGRCSLVGGCDMGSDMASTNGR